MSYQHKHYNETTNENHKINNRTMALGPPNSEGHTTIDTIAPCDPVPGKQDAVENKKDCPLQITGADNGMKHASIQHQKKHTGQP